MKPGNGKYLILSDRIGGCSMLRKLAIIISMSCLILLLYVYSALASDYIVGAPDDMPKNSDNLSMPINSVADQHEAVQTMIDVLNNGGHVVIVGGTGGAVTSSMVQEVVSGVTAKTGGQITVVGGINRDETVSMMQTYLSGGVPSGTNGTGEQTPIPGASTFGYPPGFTGVPISGYNYGQTLLGDQAPGNTTGGFLNYTFPTAPVVVTPKPSPPPKPSIEGSVSPLSGYPGQDLTVTAKLGKHTYSGKVSDGLGTEVSFTTSGSKTYTIPNNAKIGQVIQLTFYSSNAHYIDRRGNTVSVFVVNPMTTAASANPTTLAPTETTSITAITTGFVNRVSASGRVYNPNEVVIKQAVATGDNHTVLLRSDGTVWVMGLNDYAQLGTGDFLRRNIPTKLTGISGVSAIAAGYDHTVMLKTDGTVWTVGYNAYGQLGLGDTNYRATPTQIPSISGVKAISVGYKYTILLKADGTVWSMGLNEQGQLGTGDTINKYTPTQLIGISDVSAISAAGGGSHTILLKADGTVWSMGYNSYGQLGHGDTTIRKTPTQVSSISGVSAIAAGGSHTILLKTDGTVWSMGYNYDGQLGLGDTVTRKTPTQVSTISGVSAIAAGGYQTAMLKSDGTVWTMGNNYYGQLGHGDITSRNTPTQVLSISGVNDIVVGSNHIAMLKPDGTVWTVGNNQYGQLGIGNTTTMRAPTRVMIKTEFDTITAGDNHTVMLKSDGTVWTVGNNQYGQLGTDDTANRSIPTKVLGISGVKAIAAGGNHTVMLKSDGTVWTMGLNNYGQLGLGDTVNRSTPTQISGITGVSAISAGSAHTVMLKSDGTVWSMGYNDFGQLGNGQAYVHKSTPTQVLNISGVSAIAAGFNSTMLLKTDRTVWVLGENSYGQLGLGYTYNAPSIPIQVPGISDAKAISVGYWHTVILKTNGTVWSSGLNENGVLGIGNVTSKTSYVQATGINQVSAIATGAYHTVMLKSDGTVWTMGYNGYGQLGTGNTTDKWIPTQAYGEGSSGVITGVSAISAGNEFTVMLKNDKTVFSMGYNAKGQLGLGDYTFRKTAVGLVGPDPFLIIFERLPDVPSFDLTPTDPTFPSSNTWTGTIRIPYYAPIGSQFIVTVNAHSTWLNMYSSYPIAQSTIILDIANTITIGNPTATKTTVNPGDVITITVPSSNGYALAVTATGPNPSGGTIASNLSPTTALGSIPKTNTWSGTFTIPSTGMTTGSYVITIQGSNDYFVSQPPSTPKYLTLIVGSPSITLAATVEPDPVYSHWDGHDTVTFSATTTGTVKNITPTVQVNGGSITTLPDLTSLGGNTWSGSYQVPPDLDEGSTLVFSFTAFAQTNSDKFITYAATSVKRHLIALGVTPETAVPGQVISLDGSSTDGHATSLVVTDNKGSSPVNLLTTTPTAQNSTWTGNYTVPSNAKVGQTITLTWTPTDTVSGKSFKGQIDQKVITVSNTPQIIKTVFNQISPYPGASSGAPTGTVDAIIVTTGWVNALNVSWDTSYNIQATSYIDLDSNGKRQWTIKGLTVPITADVSNSVPTVLNIQGKTTFIDQVTGSVQVVTGTADLPIDNTIVATGQQLSNPVVTPGIPFTITVNTKGFATAAFAKKMDGSLLSLTPSTSVNPSIPYENTWTGNYLVPNGTASQTYQIPVFATNTTFVNQPQSEEDYISINIGGVPSIYSAWLDPYTINLPAATVADRTITLYSQTTGQVSGVQVSLSVNGGPATILPAGTMYKTSGTAPGLVSWQGSYEVDPSTPNQTQLTFTFQAKDNSGNPIGPTITPHYVMVNQTKPPKVIITH